MNPYLAISLVVGGYSALHLWSCRKCQSLVGEWIDNAKDALRSLRGRR